MKHIVLSSYAPSGVESTSETSMILGEHFGAKGRRMDKDTKFPYTEIHTDGQRVPSKSESTSTKTHWYKMDNKKVKMPAVTAGASNPGPQGLESGDNKQP